MSFNIKIGDAEYEEERSVRLVTERIRILLQSDKSKYSQGENIQIRVLILISDGTQSRIFYGNVSRVFD